MTQPKKKIFDPNKINFTQKNDKNGQQTEEVTLA